MLGRTLWAVVVVTAVLGTARADGKADEQLAGARAHVEQGRRLYEIGEFLRAADEYRQAYLLHDDPVILYNIAQAYRLAQEHAQALFFYRSFLRRAPKAPNRREVADRIEKLVLELSHKQALASPPNGTLSPGAERRGPGASPTSPEARGPSPLAPRPTPPFGAPVATSQPPISAQTRPAIATQTHSTITPETHAAITPETHAAITPETHAAITPETHTATTSGAYSIVSPETPGASPLQVARRATPVYKKWWLWTIVGVAAAGAAVGLGVGLTASSGPSTAYGTRDVFGK